LKKVLKIKEKPNGKDELVCVFLFKENYLKRIRLISIVD